MTEYKRGWMWMGVSVLFSAILLGLFFVFLLSGNSNSQLTGAAISILNSGNASQCGGINASVTLNNNVNSTGTCFSINASNIILDCRGFEINYSTSGTVGYGINNSGFDNVSIRNCLIKEGTGNSSGNNAIYFQADAENGTIFNNTIILTGQANSGVLLDNINGTNISFNNITTSGVNGGAITFTDAYSSFISSNFVSTTGSSAEAIRILGTTSANNFISNTVNARLGYPIYITNTSFDNIFLNNTFISETNYSIRDETPLTLFNQLIYNNSNGEIYWNLSNLTTDLNLTPDVTIFVQNNLLGIVEDPALLQLNNTARLRFYNLSYTSALPTLLRNGVQCDNAGTCNRSYITSTATLSGNVSTFSGNYSTEGCGVLSGNKVLRANVTGNGTCFTVNAAHIVLNCAGYQINYSSAALSGNGINNNGFNNITVQNCVIIEGTSTTNSKSAIAFTNAENGTIYNNTITVAGSFSTALNLFNSNRTNISTNTIIVRSDTTAIMMVPSSLNSIYFNRIHISADSGDTINGISFSQPSFSNYILGNNITIEGPGVGISFSTAGSAHNIFANNTLFTQSGNTINDYNTVTNNTLIYEGNFGTINWTSTNLTTNLSLIVGTTIFLENNTVGVADANSNQMGRLNSTAKITMRGLTHSTTPQLLKAGTRCDGTIFCNISYDTSTGVLTANVTSFSNYTTRSTAAPLVNISTPANGINFSTGTQSFSSTIYDDSIDTVRFVFDNGTGLDFNESPMNISGLWQHANLDLSVFTEGLQLFTVFANNTAGSINYTTSIQFTVDRTPPNVTTFGMSNLTNASNITGGVISFNVSVNDSTLSVGTVLVEIRGGNAVPFNLTMNKNFSAYHTSFDFGSMGDGFYNARIYANDTVGNMNHSVNNISLTLDRIPPNVTTFGMSNLTNASNLSGGVIFFNVSINDSTTFAKFASIGITSFSNGTQFNVTLARNFSGFHTAVVLSTMTDGFYTATIYANDSVDNVNNSVANISFTLDRTSPNVTQFTLNNFTDFVSLSPGLSADFMSLNVTVNDSTTTVQTVFFEINSTNGTRFNVSASRFAGRWNATINLSLLTESMHSARVYANDTLANINNSQYITFLVNRTNQVDAGSGGGNGGGGGGGGGGGSGGGSSSSSSTPETVVEVECRIDSDCGSNEYCAGNVCHLFECHSDDDCRPGLYCVDYACTRVFDLKIIDLSVSPGRIDFTYGMKNIFKQAGDAVLHHSIIDADGKKITSGSDVIFVGADDVIEKASLFFPPKMAPGEYQLSITLSFRNYKVTSFRSFHVAAEEIVLISPSEPVAPSRNLFGQAISVSSLFRFFTQYLWLMLVLFGIIIISSIIVKKTAPQKSEMDRLEFWVRKAKAHKKSKEEIHTMLQLHGWPELKIHLAIERAEAVQELQQKYNLSFSQINELTRFIHMLARRGVSQADTILSLQEQGWDRKIIERLVIAYYVSG